MGSVNEYDTALKNQEMHDTAPTGLQACQRSPTHEFQLFLGHPRPKQSHIHTTVTQPGMGLGS